MSVRPEGSAPRAALGVPVAVLALCAASVALHAAAPLVPSGTLWGADAFAFLPAALGVLAPLAWLAFVAAVVLRARRATSPAGSAAPQAGASSIAIPWPWRLAAVLAAMAAFWLWREGHTFLGDGTPLTQNLPRGERFHHHEPLTVVIHHLLYTWVRGWPGQAAREAGLVARDAVALGSVVAGGVFVWLLPSLGAALARLTHFASARPSRMVALLAAAVLLSQGYAQLFFGYVENYTFVLVALAAYLLAALEAIERRSSLAPAALWLLLAIAFDLSAVLLVPSWLLLVALAWRDAPRRRALARDMAIVLAAAVAAEAALSALGNGYRLDVALAEVFTTALHGHGEGGRLAYLFSAAHVMDFVNEHVLTGPFAAFALVIASARLAFERRRPDEAAWFLLAAAWPALGAAWVTGDLNLGYPRDWDLFAPFALVFAVAALGLLLAEGDERRSATPWLAIVLATSLLHTAPWVAVNASFDRSFARFQTLPLGFGRTETVVGQWYLEHGDQAKAREWLERALAANPANNAAHYHLGLLAIDDGQVGQAIAHFGSASRLRPDKDNYRLRLVDALAIAGLPDRALPELRVLRERAPLDARHAACEAILLRGAGGTGGAGDAAAATAAADAAAALAPGDSTLAALAAAVRRGDDYATLMRAYWNVLVIGPVEAD